MPQIEAIELDGRGPVYDQIKRAVTAQIRSGAWKPGDRLPSEADLSRSLATARMTGHRALR